MYMEEFEIKPDVSKELIKERSNALICLLGGIYILAIAIAARFPFIGILLSGFAIAYSLGAIMSKTQEDKKRGLVMLAAGVLGLLSRFSPAIIRVIAMTALNMGAIGLIATGIWSGVKFLTLRNKQ